MTPTRGHLALATCFLLVAAGAMAAEPPETAVTIRVQSHDAKFIGSGVGGMNVVVEDADSGEFLAAGHISGGTGDTERLIKAPISRGAALADDQTSAFVARLKVERPTRIRIRASGPLRPASAAQEISTTTWVVPGRPIKGDGVVLKLPGLIVTPVVPSPANRTIPLASDVTLMCGCPINRDGLWPAADYEVRAIVEGENVPKREVAMAFTGQTNRFAGDTAVPAAGRYHVTIWAHNEKTGNTGAAQYTVDVP
jgi:hypothetical protein